MSILQHQSEAGEQAASNNSKSVSAAELESSSRILACLATIARGGGGRGTDA
jgi:hypothetical protein